MAKKKPPGQGAEKPKGESKMIAVNRKARHDYEIVDRYEAGIQLTGAEVKSIRAGSITLGESYVKTLKGECFLVGCHIMPYTFARREELDPKRERKLLLHSKEIAKLDAQVRQKGLTVIPLSVYFNPRGRCKIELGVGRGKKHHDKREDIKSREVKRQLERLVRR